MADERSIFSGLVDFSRGLRRGVVGPSFDARIAEIERAREEDQRLIVPMEKAREEEHPLILQLRGCIEVLEREKGLWLAEKEELLAQIAALKERLNTSSRNSSLPPSQDRPDQKPPRTRKGRIRDGKKRKRGGQPGHAGHHRPLLDTSEVDNSIDVECQKDCECGGTVDQTGSPYRVQQVELPEIHLEVTEYRLGHGVCRDCNKVHRAQLPAGVVPGMFGARLLGLMALLFGAYHLSRRSVQSVLAALTGLQVSPGTVSEAERRISEALAASYEEARGAIQQAASANFDETGSRRNGKRSWIWLAASESVALFLVSPSRGYQALKAMIGKTFKGLMTSDRWHSYNRYKTELRQLCWAHLLRDFQKIWDRGGKSAAVGEALVKLTLEMFKEWGRFKDGELTRSQFRERMAPIRKKLERRLEEGAGLTTELKTARTCVNLLKLKVALWTFVDHEGIEPTNNRAERIIRNAVMWRNQSFGTWSERGDRYLERILTVIISLRLQNRNVLPWLTTAIRAHHGDGKRPSLLSN